MFNIENPLDILNHFGLLELYQINDNMKNLNKVSLNDINNTINELFNKNNLNIFVHGVI